MSRVTLMDASFGWEACPPEILWQIFKYLDSKSLIRCMLVHKRWKDNVDHFAESYQKWPHMANKMVNKCVTYFRKSNLDCRQILLNSLLWTHLHTASFEHCRTYEVTEASSMYVSKDRLIVKTKDFVKYYNIPKMMFVAQQTASAEMIDHAESANIIAMYQYMEMGDDEMRDESNKDLYLHGKTHGFNFKKDSIHKVVEDVSLYHLEDDVIYTVDAIKFTVFFNKWSSIRGEWDSGLIGRYFGTDRPEAIQVYKNTVYMVTKAGWLLKSDSSRSFKKKFFFDTPLNRRPIKWALFYKENVVVSLAAPAGSEEVKAMSCKDKQHYMILCDNMTCVTEHGEMLFIGFNTGKVLIVRATAWLNGEHSAAVTYRVQQSERTIKDPAIVALEVFEDQFFHYLFIATKEKIVQMKLTYPDHIVDYYT